VTETGDLIRQLPYPAARPLAVAFGLAGEHSPQTRLWNIPFAAYQLVRLTLLPVVTTYLEAPITTAEMPDQRAAARIAHHLSILHCPYFSSWFSLLNTLTEDFTPRRTGIEPPLPLRRIGEALERMPVRPFSERYGGTLDVSPLPAITGLRNGIVRTGGLRDDKTCQTLIRHYLPILEQILESFAALAACRMAVRDSTNHWDGNNLWFLTGYDVPGPSTLSGAVGESDWRLVLSRSPAAISIPGSRVVSLWPLFALGSFAPVGLSDAFHLAATVGNGTEPQAVRKQQIGWLGLPSHQWPDPEALEDFRQRTSARRTEETGADLGASAISDMVNHRTRTVLHDLTDWVYFPKVYLPRQSLSEQWNQFLRRDDKTPSAAKPNPLQANGFLLVGDAGSGKTSWVAHTASQLLASADPLTRINSGGADTGNLVLLLQGNMITSTGKRPLLQSVVCSMGLEQDVFPSFDRLLTFIGLSWRKSRQPDRYLIIFIDALDEAPAAANIMGEALQLIQAAARHSWCKIVITLRTDFYKTLQDRHINWNPTWGAYYQLAELTDTEAGEIHQLYRDKGLADLAGCKTAWSELPARTKRMLTSPLQLNLFHRCFSNCRAKAVHNEADLFQLYMNKITVSHPLLDGYCRRAVEIILEKESALLTTVDAMELSHRDSSRAESAIEALLTSGLMRWRSGPHGSGYLFTYNAVLERLIADSWERSDPSLSLMLMQSLLTNSETRQDNLPQYWYAFAHIFTRLFSLDGASLWPLVLNECRIVEIHFAADSAWFTAAMGGDHLPFLPPEKLELTPPGQVIVAFAEGGHVSLLKRYYHNIKPTDHTGWMTLLLHALRKAYSRQLAKSDDPVLAAEHIRLCGTLALLENRLGTCQIDAGRIVDGLSSMRRGRTICRKLIEKGHEMYLNDLATIENNMASVLRRQGDLPEALEACTEAWRIRKKLYQDNRPLDLAADLGTVELNLGNIHYQMDDLTAAAENYNQARKLFSKLLAEDGRWSQSNDLAMAETNLGNVRRRQGDFGGAIKNYHRAVDLRLCAILERNQWSHCSQLCATLGSLLSLVEKFGSPGVSSKPPCLEQVEQLATAFVKDHGNSPPDIDALPSLMALLDQTIKSPLCDSERKKRFAMLLTKLAPVSGRQSAPAPANQPQKKH
jgi:Tetratricopeptide repeat